MSCVLLMLCCFLLLLWLTLLVNLVHTLGPKQKMFLHREVQTWSRGWGDQVRPGAARDSQGHESSGRAVQLEGGCYHLLEGAQILQGKEEHKRQHGTRKHRPVCGQITDSGQKACNVYCTPLKNSAFWSCRWGGYKLFLKWLLNLVKK